MLNKFAPQKVLNLTKALELKIPKLGGNYFLTHKIDGWFVYVEYSKENDTWYPPKSSAGRTIPAISHTVAIFNKLPKPHADCVLIAEVDISDTPFYVTNGILNRTVGNYICENPRFSFHNIYFPDAPHTSYQTRYRCLQDLEDFFNKDFFRLLPILYIGEYSQQVWEHYFEAVVNEGYEGIVAARENSLYLPGKRTADLIKLKLECTVDCLGDRVEEGIGDKGYTSYTLISKRKNGNEIRTVLSKHSDQDLYKANPLYFTGKVVQIKAMEEYADGQLRQPVFQFIREDKHISEID
jgi:hypothetical protein